jgi:hypothetical protein
VAARPDVRVIRQWLWARGRQAADLAVRGYRAARREAAKDKYREYLSDAYGRMRKRYPAVESTAREALDAIGVRPAAAPPEDRDPSGPATTKKPPARRKKKTAVRKKPSAGGSRTGRTKATVARRKKTGTKKTAGKKKTTAKKNEAR